MSDLNLRHNIKILVEKAIKKYRGTKNQSKALKIGERTLYRYKQEFNLPVQAKRGKHKV